MISKAKNSTADAIRRGECLPELLAPAGSYAALEAAIEGGADAVYMGGVAYNARINAKNFTEEELKRGIALAHSFGVKIYIAANTSIYDRELDGFLRAAEFAYLAGADALIVADMGAAQQIRKNMPIELHASTQCSGHSQGASDILAEAGFSRMVLAREMSREDISAFIDKSSLEAEVFVHGALCVCHSGQCLFSSLVGGRSGNRGECAQPCRLPYSVKGKEAYPLSLKDLTLARHIPTLCELGVSSLKIEGRMKSPEYVRDVTAIWRRLLDANVAATAEDIRELEDIFSRGGFTDGYFTRKIDRKMLGVRSNEQKKITRTLKPFEGLTKKLPMDVEAQIKDGKPMMLTMSAGDKRVCVTGEIPLTARTAPINEETVKRSLSKLGDTVYFARDISVELDSGLMVPISQLNALRRKGIEALAETHDTKNMLAELQPLQKPVGKRTPMRTAMFYNSEQIPSSAYSYFDIIYTPLENYTGNTNGVALPPVIFPSDREEVASMLARAQALGAEHLLVGNIGHIELARECGLKLHGDFRLNATNNATVAYLESLGFDDIILLPELTLSQMRDIGGRTFACIYGRVPLMVTEKCVGKELGDCSACTSGKLTLTDRRGASFPILRTYKHRSTVFNSVPLYMADKPAELSRAGICMQHFIFTTETSADAERIISAYKNATPPKDVARIKRIK